MTNSFVPAVLSQEERLLARHALGLSNQPGQESYRNRYFAAPGPTADLWDGMVARGLARRTGGGASVTRHYFLTYAGAVAACDPGEGLCSEDFPYSERTT